MSRRNTRGVVLRTAIAAVVAGAVTVTGLTGLGTDSPTAGKPVDQAPVASDKPVQTEAQALRAAADVGKQVEVLGLRSERRETFANPDGSFTAREYTNPIRTVKDGRWVGIDKNLVKRPDGTWGPKAATVELSLSGGGDGKPFVSMERAGRVMALTWPYGKLPAPVVEGDTATYPDALPGVDLTVRAQADGFGHLLIVKTPEAAADPRVAKLDLGLSTDGLNVVEDASGALKAEDSAVGGTVFEAGKPTMWDSASVREAAAAKAGPKAVARSLRSAAAPSTALAPPLLGPGGGGRTAPLGVEVARDRLTLVPDQTLLRGKDTVFPVVIDPIQHTSSRTAWTGVMSGKPSEQDWKYSESTGVGKCPTDYSPVSCNGVDVRRLLFTLPISFYKGKQILNATFAAKVAHIYSATPTAEPIRLYRIGGKDHSITSSTNWSNTESLWDSHLETVDKAISPTSCTSSSQPNLRFESAKKTGPLTKQMQTAANDGWSTITLGLRASNESRFAEWKRLCGTAHLEVNYNNPPRQIKTGDMSSNPGGICTWGTKAPFAEKLPELKVIVSDPDHGSGRTDKVKVEFKVDWTDPSGVARTYTQMTPLWQAPVPGTTINHRVKSTTKIKENTTVYWSARAMDSSEAYGPWSTEGSAQRCEFVFDSARPGSPNVLSKEYPSNTTYHDGVGKYGSFTFAPNPNDSIPDGDVVKYLYAFDSDATPAQSVNASKPGGPATVSWMPTKDGLHWVNVIAVDKAQNHSTKGHYVFRVSEGRPVTAQWNLADAQGSATAQDEAGDFPADAGANVAFGREGPGGKADLAAHLDGSKDAYLDAGDTVIDTAKSFSVSAWVRPADLTRDMTVVSQDGTGEPGFTLGYDAIAKSWAFAAPVNDVDALGGWKAAATGVTVPKDQWVMVTGVYDAQTTEMKLYINTDLRSTVKRGSVWKSYGALQIGRSIAKSGYRHHFAGDLAEVRVFDRVLPAGDVAAMTTVKADRKGYWQLDEAVNGVSPDQKQGGAPLTLSGGAAIHKAPDDPWGDGAPALVGAGHLTLDGVDDYASTSVVPITGGTSFTATARAQLTSLDPVKAQTVLSLPGVAANRFSVRYRPAAGNAPSRWELLVADSDTATATVRSFVHDHKEPNAEGLGQHLAVVYDAFANTIQLYVDGEPGVELKLGRNNTLWTAKGGLQVGRSLIGTSKEHFAGALDEVRVYNGAVDPVTVKQLAATEALPDI
ncbi:LamG domain-containing protein [Streptomyces sp. CAU 1734]|uniref:LamG domain-containing protein n=1 Tax=Streptomyces sp. CAU 1734 TaxID=3140360 RepID=UPI0032611469